MEEVIAKAKDLYLTLTPEDVEFKNEDGKELADDELSAVTGAGDACARTLGGYGGAWGGDYSDCVCL